MKYKKTREQLGDEISKEVKKERTKKTAQVMIKEIM